jgi:methylenetetrahydrofolate--tRNA-(uracil-5-)-methyltransferase
MPVEVMAKRGYDTLRFGPMKPVGLIDPRVGKEYYAVVQLRKENKEGSMYNLVGFQTHLTYPEQRRVFRMIPGLENADFLRYGTMHRNTYLNSPELLDGDYSLRTKPDIYFAGQMTGVEGYIESAGSGFVAGLNAFRRANEEVPYIFPRTTMIGAMAHYISHGGVGAFTPMNANFGIIEPLEHRVKGGKVAKNQALADRSLTILDTVIEELSISLKGDGTDQ